MPNHTLSDNNTTKKQRGLFWFRHDLRLHDQPALTELCEKVDEVSFIYILDETHFSPTKYGLQRMGENRYQFLIATLADLKRSLENQGHSLTVLKGNTSECLANVLKQGHFAYLGLNKHGGFYERKHVDELAYNYPNLSIIEGEALTLFNESDLPFSVAEMPDVFSPFRRKVEKKLTPREAIGTLEILPSAFVPEFAEQDKLDVNAELDNGFSNEFKGGETAALEHLNTYLFDWHAAATYKETRNALDSWKDSTKLSPWLAVGALSPREVVRQVAKFEQQVEKNESTYWIYFELLWREFFHWLQSKYEERWFKFGGIQQAAPNTKHNPKVFVDWCNGDTGYPIIDACMKQLKATGYMSNRGRQLVASCFVHELQQDWRYGAAWFENQLLDFDVGSNWGNWLYLAGVGSDPRGHRQFNLEKQTATYDPDGAFRQKWLG
ncbi:DASH family cryptochrome [Alteromonas hispanica]|uniref:Cryptochrome DASH n=1 Tax=Alteromonas hispanica TaxID=315421 RepID=A0A6L9MPI6_9ALTE|nr:DASH family cryptochrome [Alteromonas hispanica]NDW20048.1 DASH family cryptochrome [Alteromonas hispanica]